MKTNSRVLLVYSGKTSSAQFEIMWICVNLLSARCLSNISSSFTGTLTSKMTASGLSSASKTI